MLIVILLFWIPRTIQHNNDIPDTLTFSNITVALDNQNNTVFVHPCITQSNNGTLLVMNVSCVNNSKKLLIWLDFHTGILMSIGLLACILFIASVCINPPSYLLPQRRYEHVQEDGGADENKQMSANVALELASTSQPQTCAIEEHVDMDIELSPIEEEDD